MTAQEKVPYAHTNCKECTEKRKTGMYKLDLVLISFKVSIFSGNSVFAFSVAGLYFHMVITRRDVNGSD